MKKLLLVLFLLLAQPALAEKCHLLTADNFVMDTTFRSITCNRPVWRIGQKSNYPYMLCNGNDPGTPWGGGDFEFKVDDTVPFDISTAAVHFQVVAEPRLNYTSSNNTIGFYVGGTVIDSSCNSASAKTYCNLLATNDPAFTYFTSATLSVSGGVCVGGTGSAGTPTAPYDLSTTCSSDASCTSGSNQVCVGTTQMTTRNSTVYVPYIVQAADNTRAYCTVASCAGQHATYTVKLDDTTTNIEKDFDIIGLLVCYDQ